MTAANAKLTGAVGGWRDPDEQAQLAYLFQKHQGKCALCGEPVVMEAEQKGERKNQLAACRFRLRSGYGAKGRVRMRVLAHKGCAQKRSDEIQHGIDVDVRRDRAGRWPTEFYSIPQKGAEP